MALTDRVAELVVPLLEPMGLSLYDVDFTGGNLRVTVDGPDGVLLDQLAELTRGLSRSLDEEDPVPGTYTLEVSSPGLERRLRTEAHFVGAVGEQVAVKLGPHVEGDRRYRGTLTNVDEGTIALTDDDGSHVLLLDDITKATTIFEWGPAPKPGSKHEAGPDKHGAQAPSSPSDESERRAAAQ